MLIYQRAIPVSTQTTPSSLALILDSTPSVTTLTSALTELPIRYCNEQYTRVSSREQRQRDREYRNQLTTLILIWSISIKEMHFSKVLHSASVIPSVSVSKIRDSSVSWHIMLCKLKYLVYNSVQNRLHC
jgi:hypothetical protein